MADALATLRHHIAEYRVADDAIHALNSSVSEVRAKRKELEVDITRILAQPDFAGIDRLNISEDGSMIRIQRPGTFSKPWALSKGDLREVLAGYFASAFKPNAEDCFNFICEDRTRKLVSTEFALTRKLPKE